MCKEKSNYNFVDVSIVLWQWGEKSRCNYVFPPGKFVLANLDRIQRMKQNWSMTLERKEKEDGTFVPPSSF